MDRNPVFYQVLPGQLIGSAEFLTSLIFFKPSPVPAPDQPSPGSTRRVGFQNYAWTSLEHSYLDFI
jgi:hypothetical protein